MKNPDEKFPGKRMSRSMSPALRPMSPDERSFVSSSSLQEHKPSTYVVLLSGTHVEGKVLLAPALAKSLSCPWLKAEMAHNFATFGARAQARKGYDYNQVFGRIWFSKLQRIGFLSDENEPGAELQVEAPRKSGMECTAVISCYAMRKPARDAIRDTMLSHSVKPIFVIMQITKETLSGRTVGAEESAMAERILGEKMADIEEPLEVETDAIIIDAMKDAGSLFLEIKGIISRQLAGM